MLTFCGFQNSHMDVSRQFASRKSFTNDLAGMPEMVGLTNPHGKNTNKTNSSAYDSDSQSLCTTTLYNNQIH